MDFKGKLTDRAFVKDFCVRYSDTDEKNALSAANLEIGRASCRERV